MASTPADKALPIHTGAMSEIPRLRRVVVDSLPPILRRTAAVLEREGRIVITDEGST